MIYDLIFNELLNIFNAVSGSWQYTGVEILSFILTTLFVLIFLALPLYAFKGVWSFLNCDADTLFERDYSRRPRRLKIANKKR